MIRNNEAAPRSQTDGLQQLYSDAGAIDFSDSPSVTRQEFAQEADINWIVTRLKPGSDITSWRTGERDFTLDLQEAYRVTEEAHRMWAQLPDALREKFTDWPNLLDAIAKGRINLDLSKIEQPTKVEISNLDQLSKKEDSNVDPASGTTQHK